MDTIEMEILGYTLWRVLVWAPVLAIGLFLFALTVWYIAFRMGKALDKRKNQRRGIDDSDNRVS